MALRTMVRTRLLSLAARRSFGLLALMALVACASTPGPAAAQGRAGGDSAARPQVTGDAGLIPAGYGTLRRDDVAIVMQVQGLTIRAMPLDESVIRTLAPDSYQALHAMRESRAARLDSIRRRLGLASIQAWHVSFFNVQQGEARFDPRGVQIRSSGRDFRPLDVLPLVNGFEDGRLAQGRTVDAIFVFDPAISLAQPLVVTLAGQQTSAWGDILPRIERERAAVWSRAAATRKPSADKELPPWR